jgi:hypothetical protein
MFNDKEERKNMNTYNIIGIYLMSMVVMGLFLATAWATGFRTALIVWGLSLALTAFFMAAFWLIAQ